MAIITHGNWSFREPPLQNSDVVTGGNFTQIAPDTEICVGITDLTIEGGNWVNVKIQPTWTVTGGNHAQVNRCAHLHPEWVEKGLLPSNHPENCEHVVSVDEIKVDGVVVSTVYMYEDTVI